MSQNQAEAHGGHHDIHHDGHDSHGAAHGSLRGYVTGFLLSVVLTAIPFWLVMNDVLANSTLTAPTLPPTRATLTRKAPSSSNRGASSTESCSVPAAGLAVRVGVAVFTGVGEAVRV